MSDKVVVGGNLNLNNQIQGNSEMQNYVKGSVDKIIVVYPQHEEETVNITPSVVDS